MYLVTAKGERVFNPNYGTTIQDYLFEPNTDVLDIETVVTEELESRFSKLANIQVNAEQNDHDLILTVKYSFKNSGRTDQIEVTF